jgi:V-type H+-transporting ATPase subunit E
MCSMGGVVVTSTDGRIVVNNTLDARLRIVKEEQLPAIRAKLFGVEESAAGA